MIQKDPTIRNLRGFRAKTSMSHLEIRYKPFGFAPETQLGVPQTSLCVVGRLHLSGLHLVMFVRVTLPSRYTGTAQGWIVDILQVRH